MHGSASGPLGALLLIVPLAAIPVFAIVGVPQFAPLIVSPSDDEDLVADLGDAEATRASTSVDAPRKGGSADDLFAPLPDSSLRSEATALPRTESRPDPGSTPNADGPRTLSSLPPSEALDQWEIRRDVTDSRGSESALPPNDSGAPAPPSESSEALEIPAENSADARIPADGFSPDLLKLGPASREELESRALPDANHRIQQESSAAADRSRTAEPRLARPPEQSGWQAAARRLKELGISKYRLESQIEEQMFVFVCAISSPDNPRIARRFEADADNPLEAVELVLQQIDEWRNRDHRAKLAALPPEDH
jgi:hypothetical protein